MTRPIFGAGRQWAGVCVRGIRGQPYAKFRPLDTTRPQLGPIGGSKPSSEGNLLTERPLSAGRATLARDRVHSRHALLAQEPPMSLDPAEFTARFEGLASPLPQRSSSTTSSWPNCAPSRRPSTGPRSTTATAGYASSTPQDGSWSWSWSCVPTSIPRSCATCSTGASRRPSRRPGSGTGSAPGLPRSRPRTPSCRRRSRAGCPASRSAACRSCRVRAGRSPAAGSGRSCLQRG